MFDCILENVHENIFKCLTNMENKNIHEHIYIYIYFLINQLVPHFIKLNRKIRNNNGKKYIEEYAPSKENKT